MTHDCSLGKISFTSTKSRELSGEICKYLQTPLVLCVWTCAVPELHSSLVCKQRLMLVTSSRVRDYYKSCLWSILGFNPEILCNLFCNICSNTTKYSAFTYELFYVLGYRLPTPAVAGFRGVACRQNGRLNGVVCRRTLHIKGNSKTSNSSMANSYWKHLETID